MNGYQCETLLDLVIMCETFGINKDVRLRVKTSETEHKDFIYFERDEIEDYITTDLLSTLDSPGLLDEIRLEKCEHDPKEKSVLIAEIANMSVNDVSEFTKLIGMAAALKGKQNSISCHEKAITELNEKINFNKEIIDFSKKEMEKIKSEKVTKADELRNKIKYK